MRMGNRADSAGTVAGTTSGEIIEKKALRQEGSESSIRTGNSSFHEFPRRHFDVNFQQLADAMMAAGAAVAGAGGGSHIPNASQSQRENRIRDHLLRHLQAAADDAIRAARAGASTRIGADAGIALLKIPFGSCEFATRVGFILS